METLILPKKKVGIVTKSPKLLLIYSPPKTGKTTLASQLDNSLLIDLEDGSDYVEAVKIKVNNLSDLKNLCDEILKQGKPYRYGIVDTVTKLEEMCEDLAKKMYQATPMGKTFEGNVLTLPNGAGYLYLRLAVRQVLATIKACFERTILLGHLKDKYIANKKNEEVLAKDIDLTGKISSIICSEADAIGYLYRRNDKMMINFRSAEDITCGARADHLIGQDMEFDWNKIYID